MASVRSPMNLLDLPDCMLEQILECVPYDEIAKNRVVCRRFNQICQGLLNMGFNKMSKKHAHYLKTIKAQLPRRESERRNHPLARHADILTCIETRMSMLSMTYTKYIEVNLCCFIPGKVIDEVLSVLNIISSTDVNNLNPKPGEKPLRTHEVLQELRDISSMAIDHFDEKIAPTLKKAYCDIPSRSIIGSPSIQFQYVNPDHSMSPAFLSSPDILHQLQGTPEAARITDYLNDPMHRNYIRMERKFKVAMRKLNSVIISHNRQAHKLRNCTMQVNELNAQVVDLRRRLEECTNAKPNLGQMASSSSTVEPPQTRANRNIQARTATIILKRIAEIPSVKDIPSKKAKIEENILNESI